jgi:sugar phosphate isomerase/epimerase
MKISCTPISLKKAFGEGEIDIQKFIDFCAENELDGVDVMHSESYPWQWNNPEEEFAKLPKWLEQAGIKLAAYATGNNFTISDSAEYKKEIQKVKNAIKEAADLNAPVLRIFGGYLVNCENDGVCEFSKGMEKILAGIEEVLPVAEKHNVILALENHGGIPGHSYELGWILKKFNSPMLKLNFDMANFIANNMDEIEDPLRAYDRLKGKIAHVHFKDFRKAVIRKELEVEACVAGDGIVPLRQLCGLMSDDGYDGYYSLEYEASAVVPEFEGVRRSLAYFCEIRRLQNLF